MPPIELPHTRGCIVCGRDNPHGLHLHLHVDEQTGIVTCEFAPRPEHIGFEGIIHGGVLSTVLDEAMVWCATWAGKRFCVAGEMNVRFRQSVSVGQKLSVEARITSIRSRLIEAEGFIRDASGKVLAEATGKYVPVPPDRNQQFVATLVPEPATVHTLDALKRASGAV
jgi:uncharacterized protein (TIGR00369 family)